MNELMISEVVDTDLPEILSLANKVSESHVFPTLSKQRQNAITQSLKKDVRGILDKTIYQALKAEIDNKIVGYIAWRHGCYIAQLYVDPAYQGKGIGTLLIGEVKKMATEPFLKLRSSLNATEFYLKNGFVATGGESEINGIKFLPMECKISG